MKLFTHHQVKLFICLTFHINTSYAECQQINLQENGVFVMQVFQVSTSFAITSPMQCSHEDRTETMMRIIGVIRSRTSEINNKDYNLVKYGNAQKLPYLEYWSNLVCIISNRSKINWSTAE